ncbi:hypothetical protein [Jeotgalicoccus halotolerans]|uniref:hypothetical protein n=1 Tax=Jeotgalicoccus halotolerans TaxID=157227 RepID=UPI0013BEA7D8|nr:hypothetical protein [Jeotgalicoccus halotolerans]
MENELYSKNLSLLQVNNGTATSIFIPQDTFGVFINGTLVVTARLPIFQYKMTV